MIRPVDDWGMVLADGLCAGLIWFSLMLMVVVGCRQPWRRRAIGRLALAGSLFIMPLVAFSPYSRLDVAATLRQWVRPGESAEARDDGAGWQRAGAGPRLVFWRTGQEGPPGRGGWVIQALVAAEAAAVVLGLLALLLGFWAVGWMVRRSQAPSVDTVAIYERLLSDQGKYRPRLRVGDRVTRPVLVGVFRPVILLPDELERGLPAELVELALVHELAHGRQGDAWFAMVGSLCWMIWLFVPPFWWVQRQLKVDQEYVADHACLRRLGLSGGDYARSLLELAGKRRGSLSNAGVFEFTSKPVPSLLLDRALLLVHRPFEVELKGSARWLAAVWCCGMSVLVVVCHVSFRGFF